MYMLYFLCSVCEARDESRIGKQVKVSGWVRTVRSQKSVAFVELNDGSCVGNVQIVIPPEKADQILAK